MKTEQATRLTRDMSIHKYPGNNKE